MLAFLAVQYSIVPKKPANSAHGQWLSCIGLVEAIANVPERWQNTWLCLNIGGITKRDQKGKCGARTDVLGCARLC
jgi:hypothetical protein